MTAGLYLEMAGTDAESYARERVDGVLALPGVERATWWRNVCRDRTDLPRVVPEFDALGVYECGAGFVAPAPPPGITGHHFVRTARPGQGRLTGRPTVGLSVVLISPPSPDEAQALRDWGDFVHISHIAAAGIDGFTMITPYENATGGDPRFLHLYEFDDPDAEATFQRMGPPVVVRVGAAGSPGWKAWAFHPALRIQYVNSFTLVGERATAR